jgi:hypothetical protein
MEMQANANRGDRLGMAISSIDAQKYQQQLLAGSSSFDHSLPLIATAPSSAVIVALILGPNQQYFLLNG